MAEAVLKLPAVYRLLIEYDGTRFFGWQIQPGRRTVQGEIEKALRPLFGRRVPIVGAARTDTGVHARGQVASFRAPRSFRGDLRAALNAHLPGDVAVLSAEKVPSSFHAQKEALAKTYRYQIINRPVRPALEAARAGWVARKLNVSRMRREAGKFLGRHDFSAFAGKASRGLSPYCRVTELHIRKNGESVVVEITADRFLHHMVRRIAGHFVQAGLKHENGPHPKTMEAQGLTLMSVTYPGPT
ncbi:MAG: tRNA pseudouridine(38-40) synthase TruA [Elusimicrobia bacterium]|nr:tRNA pseudouridine(38-40) synthase TruA [Elusimicrobiota bacterium]